MREVPAPASGSIGNELEGAGETVADQRTQLQQVGVQARAPPDRVE